MKSTMITSGILPLESVILSSTVTRNSENQLVQKLVKKELGGNGRFTRRIQQNRRVG